MLRDFLTAVSFLTVFPVSGRFFRKKYSLSRALVYFPLVGFLLGVVVLFLVSIFPFFSPARIKALLLVLLPIVLTAGMHIDAVADFFDGFFQGKGKQEILRIMKDTHIGAWGVTGVVFCVLLKWELLLLVADQNRTYLMALTLSRWSHVFLSYRCPCARSKEGLGYLIAGKVSSSTFIRASLLTLVICFLYAGKGLFMYAGVALFVWLMSRWYRHKIGGVTGDVLGATGEMVEIVVFVLALL